MSKRDDREFVQDIKEAARRIELYLGGMSYRDFLKDLRTQDAVVRNLEIMGEAAKKISRALKTEYPDIPWKSLAGVRDRLIHEYFGVNYEIVWTIFERGTSFGSAAPQ